MAVESGSTLLTAGYGGILKAVDPEDLSTVRSVRLRDVRCFSAAKMDPDGSRLYLGTPEGKLHSLDLKSGEVSSTSAASLKLIHKMVLNDLQGSVILSGHEYHAEAFSADSLAYSGRILGPIDDDIVDLAVSKRNGSIFMASASGSMIERDLVTGELLSRVMVPLILEGFADQGGLSALSCDDDAGILLAGCYKAGSVKGLKLDDLDLIRVWELPNSVQGRRAAVTEISPVPSQGGMIWGDARGFLCVGGYDSDKPREYWQNEESPVTALMITGDGAEVLVGYRNGVLELYSTDGWKPMARENIHRGPVVGAVMLDAGFLELSSNDVHEIDEDGAIEQESKKCELCEKEIEVMFWLCPECGGRVYRSRCPSCRRKSRHSYEYRGGSYYKCYDCGYSPRWISDGR